MRVGALLILGCLVSAPAFAGIWSNLWRTPDQQGEALLAAGRPAQAAARFTNPRRKAYADLEAGRYARAAHLLAPFKDATSEYNRGNALAHLGHLHAALAAYDAALKRAPHDRDIRHNRDLIERILAHRPPRQSPRKPGGAGKRQGRGKRAGQQAGQGKSTGAARRRGTQQGAHQGHKAEQRAPSNGQGAAHTGSQQPGHGAHSRAAAAGRGAHGTARTNTSPAQAAAGAQAKARAHGAGQARQEAAWAAAIARHQGHSAKTGAAIGATQHGPHQAARGLLRHSGAERHRPPKPRSEKTLALDQWLRQIPNNPAGLLRNKFLIEYMMRHPGATP